jgi:hypothetical protein
LLKSLAHRLPTFAYIIYAIVAFYVTAVILIALQSAKIIPLSEHASTMLSTSVGCVVVLVADRILRLDMPVAGSSARHVAYLAQTTDRDRSLRLIGNTRRAQPCA